MPFKCSVLLKSFVKMLSINVAVDLVKTRLSESEEEAEG